MKGDFDESENDDRRDDGRKRAAEGRRIAERGLELLRGGDSERWSEGVEMLKSAIALSDDRAANFYYGKALFDGRGVEKSRALAFDVFKHNAAKWDDANSEYYLAISYKFGYGVNPSDREAEDWLRSSARQGNPLAEYTLGDQKIGRIDQSECVRDGIELICLSAAQGVEDSLDYAKRLAHDGGVVYTAEDGRRAFARFTDRQAETLGRGLFAIGTAFKTGKFADRSDEEAVFWLELSVEYGSVEGMYGLGTMLSDDESPRYSPARAVSLMKRAADAGYAPAECRMGVFFHEGICVERCDEKAYEYLQRAADDGDLDAKGFLRVFFD